MVKTVNTKQMNELLKLGRTPSHPYSYRFGYSFKKGSIIVKRIRRLSSVMPANTSRTVIIKQLPENYSQFGVRRWGRPCTILNVPVFQGSADV